MDEEGARDSIAIVDANSVVARTPRFEVIAFFAREKVTVGTITNDEFQLKCAVFDQGFRVGTLATMRSLKKRKRERLPMFPIVAQDEGVSRSGCIEIEAGVPRFPDLVIGRAPPRSVVIELFNVGMSARRIVTEEVIRSVQSNNPDHIEVALTKISRGRDTPPN